MPAIIKQLEGSSVSPKDDAIIHEIFNEQNGVIRGCEITYLGSNQIRVGAGYIYVCGRLIEIEEETILSPFSETEAAGELILRIDLLSDTPAQLQARTPRQELTQNDINGGDSVYEYLLASYIVTDVAVSGLTIEYEVITAGFSKDKVLKTLEEVGAVTEYGFLVEALVVKEIYANFSMAADAIGDAIVALGVDVPEGTSLLDMASVITGNLYKPPASLSGSASFDPIAAGTTASKTIQFATPFAKVPTVIGNANGIYNNNPYALTVTISSVTATGFTVSLKNPLSSAKLSSIVFYWNASA